VHFIFFSKKKKKKKKKEKKRWNRGLFFFCFFSDACQLHISSQLDHSATITKHATGEEIQMQPIEMV